MIIAYSNGFHESPIEEIGYDILQLFLDLIKKEIVNLDSNGKFIFYNL